MTTIKICGIRDVNTLQLLQELGVDYVGFVFAPSKRQVTASDVKTILDHVGTYPKTVGVMVNPTLEEISDILRVVPLDVVQLHGQESPDFCREVKERFSVEVWKAIAVKEEENDQFSLLQQYISNVSFFLFDTHDPKAAGGTGKKFSWEQLPEINRYTGNTPYFVAGGINEENVGELLHKYSPVAIDISSSVETDGVKDAGKIKRFVGRVRDYATNKL